VPSQELSSSEITHEQILGLIMRTEQRHRVVWTAGRVLKEDGSLHRVATRNPSLRRLVLRRIRSILKELEREGILSAREPQFNFGMGKEVAFDFMVQRIS
jgi:SRSO17 transposase